MSKAFRDAGIILKFILLFQHTDIPADSWKYINTPNYLKYSKVDSKWRKR